MFGRRNDFFLFEELLSLPTDSLDSRLFPSEYIDWLPEDEDEKEDNEEDGEVAGVDDDEDDEEEQIDVLVVLLTTGSFLVIIPIPRWGTRLILSFLL